MLIIFIIRNMKNEKCVFTCFKTVPSSLILPSNEDFHDPKADKNREGSIATCESPIPFNPSFSSSAAITSWDEDEDEKTPWWALQHERVLKQKVWKLWNNFRQNGNYNTQDIQTKAQIWSCLALGVKNVTDIKLEEHCEKLSEMLQLQRKEKTTWPSKITFFPLVLYGHIPSRVFWNQAAIHSALKVFQAGNCRPKPGGCDDGNDKTVLSLDWSLLTCCWWFHLVCPLNNLKQIPPNPKHIERSAQKPNSGSEVFHPA